MDSGDDVAGMAADTERGRGHCGCVAVAVLVEVEGVAAGAGRTPEDGGDLWPMGRVFESRRCGMAIGATVVVDAHRVIGQMADCYASRGVESDAEPRCRVIDRIMGRWSRLVDMTVEATDGAGIASDDVLHRGADRGLGVDVPGGVMAGGADVQVGAQDIWPVLHRVTVGAGF